MKQNERLQPSGWIRCEELYTMSFPTLLGLSFHALFSLSQHTMMAASKAARLLGGARPLLGASKAAPAACRPFATTRAASKIKVGGFEREPQP